MTLRSIIRPLRNRVCRALRLALRPRLHWDPRLVNRVDCYGLPGRHVFFGYYDHSPLSADGHWLLAHSAPAGNGADMRAEPAQIGVFRRGDPNSFQAFSSTTAWNWQQGSRLRWMPGDQPRAIFNRLRDGRPEAVVVSVPDGAELKVLPFSIYDLSPDGRWAASLDFARLHRLRPGYGYAALTDTSCGQLLPDDDGVRLHRLDQPGARTAILPLSSIAAALGEAAPEGAEHYVNHLSISPCGSWILLVHLCVAGRRRWSRALLCRSDLSALRPLLPGHQASHYAWLPGGRLLIYLTHDRQGTFRCFDPETLREGVPLTRGDWLDGHPSPARDGRRVVVDTYPDAWGDRSLMLVEDGLRHCLLRSYSPRELDGDQRCDLHPRWIDDRVVAVDTAHAGERRVALVALKGTPRRLEA